jgi:hypothetical protein
VTDHGAGNAANRRAGQRTSGGTGCRTANYRASDCTDASALRGSFFGRCASGQRDSAEDQKG